MAERGTRILTRSDLLAVLDPDRAIEVLEDGFRRDGLPRIEQQRVRTDLPGPGTGTVLLPGLLPGVPAYTVKVNAKFPGATPALRGIVCLHDVETGELLSLLDSSLITAWRTGLAAALATHRLARRRAASVAVVGAGAQADLVLRGLSLLRPLERVAVVDVDAGAAERFVVGHRGAAPAVSVAPTLAAGVAAADMVVLATWSTEPLLGLDDVVAGQHLTSLGADEPGKRELHEDLLGAALLVVDDVGLARSMGVLASARPSGGRPLAAGATLGEVLRGEHPGRTRAEQITAYSPVGLPWQDLALAWLAYERAREADAGTTVSFTE